MIFEVLGYYFLVDTYFIMKKSYPNPTISSNSNALLNSFKKQLFFIFAFFAISVQSFAQGTTCANATTVNINGACLSNNNLTGTDSGPAATNCGNTGSTSNLKDIGWYKFTVTGGPLNVTVTAIGDRNLAFQLISSTSIGCTGLTEIACVNAVSGNQANLTTETTSATLGNGTYYVKLYNIGGGTMTLTSLCVTSNCPSSAGILSGNQYICTYSSTTTTFSSTVTGGTWSSSNASIASVNSSTGVVTASNTGTATITYTIGGEVCPIYTATRVVYVANSPAAAPAAITGPSTQCVNSTTTYTVTAVPNTSSYIYQHQLHLVQLLLQETL
jgi:hypothetical protein